MSDHFGTLWIRGLKVEQNNDTVKLALFSTVGGYILNNKNVIRMAKRIKLTKKLKLSQGLVQQVPLGQNLCTVTTNVLFLRQKTKQTVLRIKT